jgi:hypothetical protein
VTIDLFPRAIDRPQGACGSLVEWVVAVLSGALGRKLRRTAIARDFPIDMSFLAWPHAKAKANNCGGRATTRMRPWQKHGRFNSRPHFACTSADGKSGQGRRDASEPLDAALRSSGRDRQGRAMLSYTADFHHKFNRFSQLSGAWSWLFSALFPLSNPMPSPRM